jgi:hypothetical protein
MMSARDRFPVRLCEWPNWQRSLSERFTRPNFGSLTIEITVDDPKAYTRPWSVTVNQQIMLDTELIEFICLENEQSTKHFR